MKYTLLFLLLFIQAFVFAQTPVFKVPREAPLDTIFNQIHREYDMDEDDIRRSRSWGWNKYSEKIDADSFFVDTKQYCIDRLGETYFYKHFRLYYHSFKDDPYTEVFTIQYRFYPSGSVDEDFVLIIFKRLDFLNIHKESLPENVPDCQADPAACLFPINREAALQIATEQVVKGRNLNVNIHKLGPDFKWSCRTFNEGGWYGEHFTIDARTGEISTPQQWHRID